MTEVLTGVSADKIAERQAGIVGQQGHFLGRRKVDAALPLTEASLGNPQIARNDFQGQVTGKPPSPEAAGKMTADVEVFFRFRHGALASRHSGELGATAMTRLRPADYAGVFFGRAEK